MRRRSRRSSLLRLAAVTLGVIVSAESTAPARAAEALDESMIQAVARTLGFLESAPREQSFEVAVLYEPSGEAVAADAASQLTGLPGPRRATLHATAYTADDLDQAADRVDALLVMPGLMEDADRIADFVRSRRIVSVSNDPGCLAADTCVVMVNADRDVEIVLNTRLADAVGARFSTVFTMMVIRR
jgi:hypothetical protein